ncbi:hypothetical protein F442_12894 [Phytophthora nicotianae P10297]|uniref:Uncharacterized protein n=2 Tax=Phytophthora nicotianae TaxID=4792 RepID=W2YWY2_PHYNI|nr:hypothetical protein F442_12894 [Phytophthora nicotianae P10297]
MSSNSADWADVNSTNEGNKDAISSKDSANDVDSDESSEVDIISISNVVNVTELPTSTSSRASEQVTTIQNRRRVISWMEEYEKQVERRTCSRELDVLVEESRATSSATPGFGIGVEFTIRRKKTSELQGFIWSRSSSEQMGALDLSIVAKRV